MADSGRGGCGRVSTTVNPGSRGQGMPLFLILPAFILRCLFRVVPYLNLLYMSFMTHTPSAAYIRDATFENYSETLRDTFVWRVIWQTLQFGFLTTLATLILSYPLA